MNSAATSKASVPKRSTVRAAIRWEEVRERMVWRREGRDRRTVSEMSGSILVLGGRSERVIGGRKMWEMPRGREVSTVI